MFVFFLQVKIFSVFVSASKHIFRFFPQVKILLLAEYLLAETQTGSNLSCRNKIKDFILLGNTKNIFSCSGKQLQIYFYTRKQSQRFLCLRKNTEYFLLLGKTMKDKFSLAETKPKIYFAWESKKYIFCSDMSSVSHQSIEVFQV